MPVVGYLQTGKPGSNPAFLAAFQRGLREAGYVEGQNVAIEPRWAEDQYDRLPALAADLVSRRVAVIFAGSLVSSLAAKAATATVPIVFSIGADPVKSSLVASFNRPGANVTGTAALIESLGPKRLENCIELPPEVPVISMLVNASNPTAEAQAGEIRAAARTIVQQLQVGNVHSKSELEQAFSTLVQQGALWAARCAYLC